MKQAASPIVAAAVLFLALAPAAAEAQTAYVWLPKIVCGYQTGNIPFLNDPSPSTIHEKFKPGNYATTVNVVNTRLNIETAFVAVMATTQTPSVLAAVTQQSLAGLLQFPGLGSNFEFGCPEMAMALGLPAGAFFEGYALIVAQSGNPVFQVDAVQTYAAQNGFERHLLWASDFFGTTSIVWQLLNPTLPLILSPIVGPILGELENFAASGAGGLGLGASIDVERCEAVEAGFDVVVRMADVVATFPEGEIPAE